MPSLFDTVQAGDLLLANRIVMAPLTRNRAPDAIPTQGQTQCPVDLAALGADCKRGDLVEQTADARRLGWALLPALV